MVTEAQEKTQETKDGAIARAVERTLAAKAKEEEEEKLAAELEAIDAEMTEGGVPDLGDTGLQRVQALMEEFQSWDKQRASNKTKLEIAREAGDVEEAKGLLTAKPRIMKHLNIVVRQLVEALAADEDVCNEMVNWLSPQSMPSNLRPVLVKHLRERKGIDVSGLVARAQAIEEERRKLRRLTQQQG